MDEKTLGAVGGIAATVVWGYVIFYVLGFGNVLLLAMQRTGNIGSVFIVVVSVIIFFIPFLIVNAIMSPKEKKSS